jgi:phosphoribosylanthranilate isomerase
MSHFSTRRGEYGEAGRGELFVKLCGIRTRAELEAAVGAGADAVGFVLTPSPRQISLPEAAILMKLVPEGVLGVAVFHDPSPDLLSRTDTDVAPDLFQAELGALDGLPRDRILPVVVDRPGLETAIDRALDASTREMVLVDSAARGGTGRAPDWDRLAGLVAHDRLILAGGLTPENVAAAVIAIHPLGVDVSSGIERNPGGKDPDLMRAFVAAARGAEPPSAFRATSPYGGGNVTSFLPPQGGGGL